LLIDCDPQANATSGLGIDKATVSKSLYDTLLDSSEPEAAIIATKLKYLDLLPAHINLVAAELELVERDGREKLMRDKLSPVKSRYDFIIYDCPPSLGLLTLNAMVAADEVIVPIQAEYYALEGLSQLLQTIELVRRGLNPG
jgi:chromosome partitioning protein